MVSASSQLILLVILAHLFLQINASGRHMICKDVENVFDDHTSSGQSRIVQQRMRGKAGPMGPPGLKGERGRPGEVDYDMLKAAVLEEVNATLERELAKIHETLRLLNHSLQPKPATCTYAGSITYNNKCYWLILHNSADVTFAHAQELCSQGGGRTGDILSQAHYDLVDAKCREMTSSTRFFWLGMKINPSTNVVTLSNGTEAPFTKWYPGWPHSYPEYTKVTVQINQPPSPDGMFHRVPTGFSHGVFCQS